MAYDPNIPTAGQLISVSQSLIQGNFAAIDSAVSGFAVDHVTLTDGANGGKHKKMTMVQQVAAPNTAVAEMALYTKDLDGSPELYARLPNNGTEVLMTRGAPTASSGEGIAYGGLQIRAGQSTLNAQGESFNFSSPFSTACIGVMVTNRSSGNNLSYFGVVSFNATGFTLRKSDTDGALPQNFAYIAVGY